MNKKRNRRYYAHLHTYPLNYSNQVSKQQNKCNTLGAFFLLNILNEGRKKHTQTSYKHGVSLITSFHFILFFMNVYLH